MNLMAKLQLTDKQTTQQTHVLKNKTLQVRRKYTGCLQTQQNKFPADFHVTF